MNRLEDYFDSAPSGDFWVVRGECGWYQVTPEVARELERQLDRADVPTWVTFTDYVGSRVRVRSKLVHAVYECSVAQRSAQRALDRALEREEKAEKRPWEDD